MKKERGGQRHFFSKYISILYRLGNIYYDAELEPYQIGCGQQFFLLRIHEYPGTSLLELARKGYYDKGTTARAVKKLEDQGYIKRDIDPVDKRIHKLFITEKAIPVIEETYAMLENWNKILTEGLSQEEKAAVDQLTEKMAENANAYFIKRRKEKEWNNQ